MFSNRKHLGLMSVQTRKKNMEKFPECKGLIRYVQTEWISLLTIAGGKLESSILCTINLAMVLYG